MQLKNFTLMCLALCSAAAIAFAQDPHPSCEGDRYRADIFDDVVVTTNIQFGENTTIAGNTQALFMDVYEPAGDEAESRPAVVMAFGGAFVAGERQDLDDLCRSLARKGYVAATIDYRLFDFLLPLDSNQMHDVVVKAIGDMKASIRYLRQDAATDNLFRIDTSLIFAGGISAGAITAAHVAHLDAEDDIPGYLANIIENNGGMEGNSSDNYQYSSAVAGLVNYSGALKLSAFIDENDPPQFSVHDEGDGIVVYNKGLVSAGPIVFVYLEGSLAMHNRALEAGVSSELMTIPGGGHVSYFTNNAAQYEAEVEERTAHFLANQVCGLVNGLAEAASPFPGKAFPNPAISGSGLHAILPPSAGEGQLVLRNIQGQPLFQVAARGGQAIELPAQTLPAGMYLLEWAPFGGGQFAAQRIIIR